MDNPCTSWLVDSSWDNITELDKLLNFHGIMASFEQYPQDWNLWFTSAEPEKAALPGLYVCMWRFFFIFGTLLQKKTHPTRNNEVGAYSTDIGVFIYQTDLINKLG